MVSSVINRAGTGRKHEFSRTDEYLFLIRFGKTTILMEQLEGEKTPVTWDTLRRSGPSNTRDRTKRQFYPVFVNNNVYWGFVRAVGNQLYTSNTEWNEDVTNQNIWKTIENFIKI